MKTWDRVAWVSSWVAQTSIALFLAALALAFAVQGGVTGLGSVGGFAIAALVCGSVGAIAHLLVVYRVRKAMKAPKLAMLLQFGMGYAEARRAFERGTRRSQS